MAAWHKLTASTIENNIIEFNSNKLGNYAITTHSDYYYGDGSLNTVKDGYKGKLLINDNLADCWSTYSHGWTNFAFSGWGTNPPVTGPNTFGGSFNKASSKIQHNFRSETSYSGGTDLQFILAGDNDYALETPCTGERTVQLYFTGTVYSFSCKMDKLKIKVDGNYYIINECIENGFIKPLVLLSSIDYKGSTYCWPAWANMLTGEATDSNQFPIGVIVFMTNSGYEFQGIHAWADHNWYQGGSYNPDGWSWYSCDINDCRLTLTNFN